MTDNPTATWTLDPDRSSLTFAHKSFWGMMTVKGRFAEFTGLGEVSPDGQTAFGTLVVKAASVNTDHSRRDEHLRSAMFFDAEQHPEIIFDAGSVGAGPDETVRVTGRLVVKDRSSALDFTAKTTAPDTDTVRLTATVEVDRAEFGINKNVLGMIKGPATVNVDLVFHRESR